MTARAVLIGFLLGLIGLMVGLWLAEATFGFRAEPAGVVWLAIPMVLMPAVVGGLAWRGGSRPRSRPEAVAAVIRGYFLGALILVGLNVLVEIVGFLVTRKVGTSLLALAVVAPVFGIVALPIACLQGVITHKFDRQSSDGTAF
jgi:hypothetical protein